MEPIVMYGAEWCADCMRAKFFFQENSIPYTYIDVDQDAKGMEILQSYTKGEYIVPVIVYGQGKYLIEPTYADLATIFTNDEKR